jgi:hypothetical protein
MDLYSRRLAPVPHLRIELYTFEAGGAKNL